MPQETRTTTERLLGQQGDSSGQHPRPSQPRDAARARRPRPPAFTAGSLGPLTLRNRIIKAATFEGMSHKGLVGDKLIDFHRAVAAGGVAMTTLAYCAVSREGQGAPHEIVLRPEALPGLRKLTEAVHAEGAAASAQIGHAGPVGSPRVTGTKALARVVAASARSAPGITR